MHDGYCAKLHHEMTGTWPGDRRNIGRRGAGLPRPAGPVRLLTTDEVIELLGDGGRRRHARSPVSRHRPVPSTCRTMLSGAPFRIPIVAPVGVKSGDGRKLRAAVADHPRPAAAADVADPDRRGPRRLGDRRPDRLDGPRPRTASLINARGVFDVGPYGQEAERLVRHKFLRGVSVDLDNFEAEARSSDAMPSRSRARAPGDDEVVRIMADDMTVTNGRVMGARWSPSPRSRKCTIELEEDLEEEPMVADGTYIGTPETEAETEEMIRSALTAAGIPVHPPARVVRRPGPEDRDAADDQRRRSGLRAHRHLGLRPHRAPVLHPPAAQPLQLRLLPHRPAAHRRRQRHPGRPDHPGRWARLAGGRRRDGGQALRRHRLGDVRRARR